MPMTCHEFLLSCRRLDPLACRRTGAPFRFLASLAFLCCCAGYWVFAGHWVEMEHGNGALSVHGGDVGGGGASAADAGQAGRQWMFMATTTSHEVLVGLPEKRCTCGTLLRCNCVWAAKQRSKIQIPSVSTLIREASNAWGFRDLVPHPNEQGRSPDSVIVSFHHRVLEKSLATVLSSPEVFEHRRVDRRSRDVSLKFDYLLTLATWNHLIYALAHGLPLLHVHGEFPDLTAHRHRRFAERERLLGARSVDQQPHWNKYFLLELVLQTAAPSLSWVFWVDMDAMFMNIGVGLSHVLDELSLLTASDASVPAKERSTRCAVVWSGGARERLNNGVGFFRTRTDAANVSVAETLIKGVWNTVTRQHIGGTADNSATLYYLRKKATTAERSAVCIAPRHALNAFPTELVGKHDQRNLAMLESSCSIDPRSGTTSIHNATPCREAYAAVRGFFRDGDWMVHFPGLRARKSVAISYFCRALEHPIAAASGHWFALSAVAEDAWTGSSQARVNNAGTVRALCQQNQDAMQRAFHSYSHLRRL